VTVASQRYPPRSPTDIPTLSGRQACRVHPEHCYKLQAEAHSGLLISVIRSHDYYSKACTRHRRRRSVRKPAAACGTRACSLHGTRNMQLAGSPAVANKPAEAALCLESGASIWTRVYHPNMPDLARTFCAQSRPILILDQCQLEVGWAWLARAMRLAPPMSLDHSRSNARGRSDLHSPDDAWTSQTHDSPGILQDRRGMNAVTSPFRQNGGSRLAANDRSGFREQIDGSAGRVRCYTSKLEIRATTRAFHGPGDRQAPIFRQESEGGISEANSGAAGRRDRMELMSGNGTVGSSSWHAGSATGWLTPRSWEQRMLQNM
jgi:hypothetical protein